MTESQTFTCSNPSCGKVFVNPVKVKNLALKEAEPYYACPYCLTETVLEERTSAAIKKKQKKEIKQIEIKESVVLPIEEKSGQKNPKAQECTHHFGYLSKRSSNDEIPEECMICENLVQCMLVNVTC
jgi:DNA-directed RNA polymerase subunit RPC12/RpoP